MRKVNFFFIYSIFTLLVIHSYLPAESKNSKSSAKELQEKKVEHMLHSFFNACRSKNFQIAYNLTIGKEQKYYANILRLKKKNNGMIPAEVQKYFNRLRKFEVDLVEVDLNKNLAFAICFYKFVFFDSVSKDKIYKYRVVHYYLKRVNGKWKIAGSKLKNELYRYDHKTRRGKIY